MDTLCAQEESNTIQKIHEACEGESACELIASPVFFDRFDCPNVQKFIKVNWQCLHAESRIKDYYDEEDAKEKEHALEKEHARMKLLSGRKLRKGKDDAKVEVNSLVDELERFRK